MHIGPELIYGIYGFGVKNHETVGFNPKTWQSSLAVLYTLKQLNDSKHNIDGMSPHGVKCKNKEKSSHSPCELKPMSLALLYFKPWK